MLTTRSSWRPEARKPQARDVSWPALVADYAPRWCRALAEACVSCANDRICGCLGALAASGYSARGNVGACTWEPMGADALRFYERIVQVGGILRNACMPRECMSSECSLCKPRNLRFQGARFSTTSNHWLCRGCFAVLGTWVSGRHATWPHRLPPRSDVMGLAWQAAAVVFAGRYAADCV
jgi:hypothetical protein